MMMMVMKIVIFSYPLAFEAPVQGVLVGILPSRLLWCGKTRIGGATRWLKNFEDICNRLESSYRRTDGQTGRHLATA